MRILYEDNHLLVLDKPAGIPTMGASEGCESVVTWGREYLRRKYSKPGNVYVGVVSRLDASVSGVILLARTSKAAARLCQRFRDREVGKTYWALVAPAPAIDSGNCQDWIAKNDARQRMEIVAPAAREARDAELSFRVLRRQRDWALLEVRPETGRKHQIRLQLAARGWPILGDRKYGGQATVSQPPFAPGIALHARKLELTHPVRQTAIEFTAPLPSSWTRFGISEDP